MVEEIFVEASLPSVGGSALCARYALCMAQDHGVPTDPSKEQFLVYQAIHVLGQVFDPTRIPRKPMCD